MGDVHFGDYTAMYKMRMITLQNLTEDNYFLPEDGDVARKRFLELLALPTETYISAYGFNMKSAFEIIKSNDASGVKYHLLLDYLQSQGPSARDVVKDLNRSKKNSDVTLTTAGIGSRKTSQIWHWKGLVKFASDGGEPFCLEGSTNFSDSAWFQGNSMRVFRSQVWADRFIEQFTIHKEWALGHEPQYQATILQTGYQQDPVDAYFDRCEAASPIPSWVGWGE